MKIKYEMVGVWVMKYVLYLPKDREIVFAISVIVLNPEEPLPICESSSFHILDTWLGDEDPVSQVSFIF
jgi:hypothetical protein